MASAVVWVAVVGGFAICLQSLFSGVIGEHLGTLESVFAVHLGGLVLAGLLLVLKGGNFSAWREVSLYAWLAGFLGVVIVGAVAYAVPRLGLGTTLALTITAQLLLGAFLDHFGLLGAGPRPLDLTRGLGMVILVFGAWLILR